MYRESFLAKMACSSRVRQYLENVQTSFDSSKVLKTNLSSAKQIEQRSTNAVAEAPRCFPGNEIRPAISSFLTLGPLSGKIEVISRIGEPHDGPWNLRNNDFNPTPTASCRHCDQAENWDNDDAIAAVTMPVGGHTESAKRTDNVRFCARRVEIQKVNDIW